MADLIYRVQDRDGRGPYRPGFSHRWVEMRPDLYNLAPWFAEWPGLFKTLPRGMHMGCGTRDIEQLRRWFTKSELESLRRLHFHAVIMEVDKILAEGPTQVVFARMLPLAKGDLVRVQPYPDLG